ncbi:MAG: hypothetical protein COS94_03430 [Candidatus Hydrogenedentes bacterium CG07_land_8_20_14_0_80_42_17]|nr:MAG: hypothetical protein COS94_03430 [Candidatus Hydrogenedentes bacterium CG07_land_8_20_14_0_80_42_17]
MKRIAFILSAIIFIGFNSIVSAATPNNIPEWAVAAAARCRKTSIQNLYSAMSTAGVRGAEVRAEELYWMEAGKTPNDYLESAESAETSGNYEEAEEYYKKVLLNGGSGKIALRAGIGVSVMMMRRGQIEEAIRRLETSYRRADEAELQFISAMPLSIAYASNNQKEEGIKILEEVIRRYPNNSISGTADSLLTVLKSQ